MCIYLIEYHREKTKKSSLFFKPIRDLYFHFKLPDPMKLYDRLKKIIRNLWPFIDDLEKVSEENYK